ncbi:hypothetical protein COO60DRAFT_1117721 [Scenedesmus sp. NREL 46B-D3]|nr:hypothetical protein COO60DRAFT_1117721 [Scenedesmus sp. NREL 46B-D3]
MIWPCQCCGNFFHIWHQAVPGQLLWAFLTVVFSAYHVRGCIQPRNIALGSRDVACQWKWCALCQSPASTGT